MMKPFIALAAFAAIICNTFSAQAETRIRFGHFPNITHAQALVAHQLSRQGKGWFEERLGKDVKIDWFVYNAGPSAMEAIFADSVDLTYVGPSPSLNAFSKSGGEEIRIIAGSATGGAALVVQSDSTIKTGADFRGKRIATPQLGNTQDVACRAWLASQGLKITQLGGDAQVLPTENPDQLSLFQQKKLDAAWTVEPWVSRLVREAGGKVFLEDKDSIATVLVSSVKFLKDHRDLAKKLVAAQKELTEWIKTHPEEAQKMVVAELSEETKGKISPELVAAAWSRITPTSEVSLDALETFVKTAQSVGFLRSAPDLGPIIETP